MTSPNNPEQRLGASFRDPSGFLFQRDGILYRQINHVYREQYDLLMSSGLYARLAGAGLLIPHREVDTAPVDPLAASRVIQPELLPFISYPYEWCFSQLKDAALATLYIQNLALQAGMVLKDASAYNIQFMDGKPILIDTLSFERYREGEPWVAYRQYCQHFLAPLALMAHRDIRLGQLLRVHLDGVPLDLASALLPRRTHYSFGLATHIHLHASAQKRYAGGKQDKVVSSRKISKLSLLGLIDSLENATRKLDWKPAGTEWGDYYAASAGHYSPPAMEHKRQVVTQYLERVQPARVWDLGANTGDFSRLASEMGASTLAMDVDPAAVEINYLRMKEQAEHNLLPLIMDFSNPSPSLGWHGHERLSLLQRGSADVVLALAIIHHLAISNNVPLFLLADYFHELGHWLIIEWVPKDDSQVQVLLSSRSDIFIDYHQDGFESAFSRYFNIDDRTPIIDSGRVLYLMEKKF
ncbi:MAG: SAM-dependent methyltransferase [Anaerolineales bacterium]|nr:SAM-dependent methyltransferase [Anaerolineae bacterium]PWB53540.1 MAG: SAM-dependent methyltransferase [Anaerolineales bacterium]